ncbi:MAG: HPt (histidine-containing phosphotransfer) domain-containing protein [Marinoscillum sp.]|jgi:HPt (histidine-containing phosphotransfer) domain-containing protein
MIDFSYLISIADGDQAFIEHFISTFESNNLAILDKMEDAYENGDLDTIRKLAHQLKPALEMFKLSSLIICQTLEMDPPSASLEAIEKIRTNCEYAISELKSKFI